MKLKRHIWAQRSKYTLLKYIALARKLRSDPQLGYKTKLESQWQEKTWSLK